ncbi:MAG: glycosyltransferase family 2 protein [Anaerolineales bacterium]
MKITANHPSFVVALPMYNEEPYAERCLRTIFPVLDRLSVRNAIVAVNDGSRDHTLSILENMKPEYERLHVVNHQVNRGYGGSIRTAYKFAIDHEYDYVLFMDADLTQDPLCILNFLQHMANGVEMIKASRYIDGSQVIGVPRFRIVVSSLGNALARLAFHLPITDYTNGFRAVKISLAKQFDLKENHFPILVEEMWQAKHFAKSYAEVNYSLTTRQNEEDSKFKYDYKVYAHYLKFCIFALLNIPTSKIYKEPKG